MNIKKIAIAAVLATGFVSAAAQAVVINENFGTYAVGTAVTTQVAGVTFGLIGGPGFGGNPIINNGGLTNSNSGYYPTANILDVDFIGVANGVTFNFNNEGSSSFGRGHTSYTAYDLGGNVLETGFVGGGGSFALTSANIADLRFDNGTSGGDSWIFDLDTLHANVSDVPEPASLALLGLGLAGFAASRRKLSK